jgi:L-seryl-tRNA(Ser) seleniumtransferase
VNLRDLPSVDELARDPRFANEAPGLVVSAARAVLDVARDEIRGGGSPTGLAERVEAELAAVRRPSLRRAINATGVVLHTNLGRAPLAPQAMERIGEVARGYSNLEYDAAAGTRGSRQTHVADLLRRLTGAEDALVVNNNAAAIVLALAALAGGREALVSRGELVEIGDGFRIAEVLACSGARLVEVGATNRTHLADYERAAASDTAAVLRVHHSNFRMVGFAGRPSLAELVGAAHARGLLLVEDLGSGSVLPFDDEPTVRDSVAAGADLVCFSGDKLLGGPQAGLVVGGSGAVERLRRHPLHRAVRADKLTLAALEGTLALYLAPAPATAIPVLRMLREPADEVRRRAARLAELTGGELAESTARVGGGALPLAELPSFACLLEEQLAAPLRAHEPAVVGVVRDGRLRLDCRTVADAELDEVAAAVAAVRDACR